MPNPRKRGAASVKANPAKKGKGKKVAKPKGLDLDAVTKAMFSSPKTMGEKVANIASILSTKVKGAQTFLMKEENFDQLWSVPTFFVSTRSLELDRALGIPGLPGGKLVEIYGDPGAGKSTLGDQILAETQAMGGIACLVDDEAARDLKYVRKLGVNTDELIVSQTTTMEDVFEIVREMAFTARKMAGPGVPVTILWDSVAGTPTREELESPSDQFRASAAKVLRQQCRTTMLTVAKEQVLFVATNQLYKKMATGKRHFFSDDDETYGGGAIKYHSSVRIATFKKRNINPRGWEYKEGEPIADPIGQETGIKTVKNKLAAPNKYRTLSIMYGQGIDNRSAVFDALVGTGLVAVNGSWLRLDEKFGKTKPWQSEKGVGWWGLADLVHADPELWAKLVVAYKAIQ